MNASQSDSDQHRSAMGQAKLRKIAKLRTLLAAGRPEAPAAVRPSNPSEPKELSAEFQPNGHSNSHPAKPSESDQPKETLQEPNQQLPRFSDPYLLSSALKNLIGRNAHERALDILANHRPAVATPPVVSTVISALSKHALHEQAVNLYKASLARNSPPSQHGLTSILRSIAKIIPKSKNQESLLALAKSIWLKSNKNRPQTNTMLSVCMAAASNDAWQTAQSVFYAAAKNDPSATTLCDILKHSGQLSQEDLSENEPEMPLTIPDIRTYTIMTTLCANIPSHQTTYIGFHTWKTALVRAAKVHLQTNSNSSKQHKPSAQNQTEASESSDDFGSLDDPFVIDNPFIASFLFFCFRSANKSSSEHALETIPAMFGLPTSPKEAFNPKPNPIPLPKSRHISSEDYIKYITSNVRLELNTQILTLLIQLASRLRYPALGQHWFDIGTKQLNVNVDVGLIHAISSMYLSNKQYDSAWDMAIHPDQSGKYTFQIGLRACSLAVINSSENHKEWLKRCMDMYKRGHDAAAILDSNALPDPNAPLFGHREVLNTLTTSVVCKSWHDAIQVIFENREILIDAPSKKLEHLVERQARTLGRISKSSKKNAVVSTIKQHSMNATPETKDLATKLDPLHNPSRSSGHREDPRLLCKGLQLCGLVLEKYIQYKMGEAKDLVRAQLALQQTQSGLNCVRMLKLQTSQADQELLSRIRSEIEGIPEELLDTSTSSPQTKSSHSKPPIKKSKTPHGRSKDSGYVKRQ